jgi:hypothetical protein
MKQISKTTIILFVLLVFFAQIVSSQITGPGEPVNGGGASAPLDGGLLLGLLAGGSFIATFFVKQKKKNSTNK